MRSLRKTVWSLYLILLLLPFQGISQNTEAEGPSRIGLIGAAREIMTGAGTCALITLDDQGLPRVRVMDPFAPESDLTVWLGTNPKSGKVDQIRKNPNVTLYYLDSDASGYVVIHGKAQLVDDQAEKEKWWKAEWEAFYPDKPEGYLLIRVTPVKMEILSYSRGIFGDPATWQVPGVVFDPNE